MRIAPLETMNSELPSLWVRAIPKTLDEIYFWIQTSDNRFGFLFCHIVLTFQFLELLPFEFPKFPKSPLLTTHTQAYELISQFILVNGR